MDAAEKNEEQPLSAQLAERWQTVAAGAVAIAVVIAVARFAPFSPVSGAFDGFSWLTEHAVDLAKELFERYGYLTVFLAPMLENTIFLGALIPGTLVMLLAGLSAHDGIISFWPAVLLATAGAIIGDTISYGIGRFGWQRLGPETRLVQWTERMREPLLNHSIWLVLTYHFAGYSRLVGPAAAGFLRMPLARWMLLDYIGVALWVFVFLSGGYLLGVAGLSLDSSDRNIQIFEVILFAFFIIAIVTVMRATRSARRRQQTTPAVSPDGHATASIPAAEPDETAERVG